MILYLVAIRQFNFVIAFLLAMVNKNIDPKILYQIFLTKYFLFIENIDFHTNILEFFSFFTQPSGCRL